MTKATSRLYNFFTESVITIIFITAVVYIKLQFFLKKVNNSFI